MVLAVRLMRLMCLLRPVLFVLFSRASIVPTNAKGILKSKLSNRPWRAGNAVFWPKINLFSLFPVPWGSQ